MTRERVELWREPSGFWRWRYVSERDGSDDVRLLSNMEFASEQAARDAAEAAYPDLVIQDVNHQADASDERADGSSMVTVTVVIVAVAAGVVVARARRRRARSSRRRRSR